MTASPKATRLLAELRVMPGGVATIFNVQGDHGHYRVTLGDGWTHCTCLANRERCSHVEASLLLADAMVEARDAERVAA